MHRIKGYQRLGEEGGNATLDRESSSTIFTNQKTIGIMGCKSPELLGVRQMQSLSRDGAAK